MGEIADMIIEGILCQGCGGYIDEEAPGYPRDCSECAGERKYTPHKSNRVKCVHCAKMITQVGMGQHMKAKHPGKV